MIFEICIDFVKINILFCTKTKMDLTFRYKYSIINVYEKISWRTF